jgi:3'-phosphoadenosine 5'-phosphosulfate sulfotransferase (PAPS reductase)/FAD synthetase
MEHVVALSGGKDSTAMALRLAEIEPRKYRYVCTPTGDESPEMFEHWRRLGGLLASPIIPVVADSLSSLIRKQRALPNWRQRWCTRILKIEPYARYLASLGQCVSYVGLRADEPLREGGDYAELANVTMDFPLRRWHWTLHDVRSYLSKRCIEIPARTDCLKCFFQRLDEWFYFWRDYRDSWMEGEELEATTGHTFRSAGRDSWPAAMKDMRLRFERGDVPAKAVGGTALKGMQCRVCRM